MKINNYYNLLFKIKGNNYFPEVIVRLYTTLIQKNNFTPHWSSNISHNI